MFKIFFRTIFLAFLIIGAVSAQAQNSDDAGASAAAEKAVNSLPFPDIAGDDLRPSEKRMLVREITKLINEYGAIVEALLERLKEAGHENPEALVVESFAFALKNASSAPAEAVVAKKIEEPKSETPKIAEPAEEKPAARVSRRARTASVEVEKKSDEMPIVAADGTTFDAKEGILTVSYEGGGGATAFVAELNGKPFVVTNLHVATGGAMSMSNVHGVKVDLPDRGFAAVGRDLYIIPLDSVPEGVKVLPMAAKGELGVKSGDQAMVCGNAQGLGVLVVSHGKILAIGPDMLETDCTIFRGNSGSPMYHKDSKKIVGVISHFWMITDDISNSTRSQANSPIKSEKRDFGVRMDSVDSWVPLPPSEAASQYEEITAYKKKLRYAMNRLGGNTGGLSNSDYPEFVRIESRTNSSYNFRQGGYSELNKVKVKEMLNDLSRLLNNEAARIKSRKFSDAFKSDVDAIAEAFIKEKDRYANEAKSINLK